MTAANDPSPTPPPSSAPNEPHHGDARSKPPRKPRISYLIATALGLGYVKPGPGTFGSLAGIIVATGGWWTFIIAALIITRITGATGIVVGDAAVGSAQLDPFVFLQIQVALGVAVLGVFTARRVANYAGVEDPQFVVIDEVSGQQLTLLLGGFGPARHLAAASGVIWSNHPLALSQFVGSGVNWRYLVLGFILFRVFDIWKPFPVRQAESLPGGWGIMADDWLAAVYAAAGLWIARAIGL
jgi:phosphatidylglycerophosphatase A